jgi:hypothetical protein
MNPELIEVVKQHAVNNYETDGWDILVECWSDEEIGYWIEDAHSEWQAITLVSGVLKSMNERRMEIISA